MAAKLVNLLILCYIIGYKGKNDEWIDQQKLIDCLSKIYEGCLHDWVMKRSPCSSLYLMMNCCNERKPSDEKFSTIGGVLSSNKFASCQGSENHVSDWHVLEFPNDIITKAVLNAISIKYQQYQHLICIYDRYMMKCIAFLIKD